MACNPQAGLFGPESRLWSVNRESLVFLGAGRAMVLQTAHPWVAESVARRGTSLKDPIGRFHRTFTVMFSMVFGSLDQALGQARTLHRIHAGIRGPMSETVGPFLEGSPYSANDAEAMLWVQATLWDTTVRMHELVLGPWSPDDLEAYYADARRQSSLFGIPEDMMPADWSAFQAYMDSVLNSGVLAAGTAGRRVVDTLLLGKTRRPLIKMPAWYVALTAQTLPPHIRDLFDIPYGDREQRLAERWTKRVRTLYPHLPDRLRYVPSYWEAMGRIEGAKGPDSLTRMLNLLWVGRSSLVA